MRGRIEQGVGAGEEAQEKQQIENERKNENRKKNQEKEPRERGIGMASQRWGVWRKERTSERAIESERGRILNKKGKQKDRKKDRKTEMKGHLKTKGSSG